MSADHSADQPRLFLSEEEAAAQLGIHRTTLRALALAGRSPIEPVSLTAHKRIYRLRDLERLGGVAE
ncbi:helix-turn-helix domain-containing protein [Microbacterium sp. EST19A]|uniref:helix-turn-helix domain-containing protein n=1 Tax=Microbacterium sp. EST19A TaxID=2862681 RepID=UPI001CC0CA7A|nr:helix-turn-helix domain-containing protein [Microbacterium sp. EST19A]